MSGNDSPPVAPEPAEPFCSRNETINCLIGESTTIRLRRLESEMQRKKKGEGDGRKVSEDIAVTLVHK